MTENKNNISNNNNNKNKEVKRVTNKDFEEFKEHDSKNRISFKRLNSKENDDFIREIVFGWKDKEYKKTLKNFLIGIIIGFVVIIIGVYLVSTEEKLYTEGETVINLGIIIMLYSLLCLLKRWHLRLRELKKEYKGYHSDGTRYVEVFGGTITNFRVEERELPETQESKYFKRIRFIFEDDNNNEFVVHYLMIKKEIVTEGSSIKRYRYGKEGIQEVVKEANAQELKLDLNKDFGVQDGTFFVTNRRFEGKSKVSYHHFMESYHENGILADTVFQNIEYLLEMKLKYNNK